MGVKTKSNFIYPGLSAKYNLVKNIIENKKYALLNTNPNGDVFRKLPPELRFAIPEYIKDNVSLNKFVA